jgi:hypothetical protein
MSYLKGLLISWWWILRGKPMLTYHGFHCGCCGKWWDLDYYVPDYDPEDDRDMFSHLGVCPKGKGCWGGGGY